MKEIQLYAVYERYTLGSKIRIGWRQIKGKDIPYNLKKAGVAI